MKSNPKQKLNNMKNTNNTQDKEGYVRIYEAWLNKISKQLNALEKQNKPIPKTLTNEINKVRNARQAFRNACGGTSVLTTY